MMNPIKIRIINLLRMGLDFILIFSSYLFTFLNEYLNFYIPLSVLSVVIFYIFGLYSWPRVKYFKFMLISTLFSVLFISAAAYILFSWYEYKNDLIYKVFITAIFQFIVITGTRIILWSVKRIINQPKKVLIIVQDQSDSIIQKLNNQDWDIKGILSDKEKSRLENMLQNVDVVIFHSNLKERDEIIRKCLNHGKEVLIIPEDYDLLIINAKANSIGDSMLVSIRPLYLNKFQKLMKRGADIILSVLMIIFFSPVMLLLYFLIPVISKGPVIYKQERIGISYRPFMIYKFRSMVSGAETNTGPVFALENDPRVTRVGKFIRAIRLDELPQLFNVLKGEMSIIGPRPERPFFVEQYLMNNPNYSYRFAIKPGITGLAQIMGKYSSSAKEKLSFDLMYIQNYSFILDIVIFFRTIYILFQTDNSKGIEIKAKMVKPVSYHNLRKDIHLLKREKIT